MKNNPLISIIIPVYNVERFLSCCINSVISQTYKNLEIILIDDGSTDKSGLICDEFKAKDNRIVVIHQKNKGVSAARNAGLDIFKGEYVAFVDGDDYADKTFIENLYNNLKKYHTDMAVCGKYIIYPENRMIIYANLPQGVCTVKDYFNNAFYTVFKLFKRSLFDNARFTVGQIFAEDAELVYRLVNKCRNVSATGTPLYYYRMRKDSASCLDEKIYKFYFFDLDFLSKRLIYFYDRLTNEEINFYFRECISFLLNGNKYKNVLYKKEGKRSYSKMYETIKNKLTFKSRLFSKFPRTYQALRKTLKPILAKLKK